MKTFKRYLYDIGIAPIPQTINVPAKRRDVDSDEQYGQIQQMQTQVSNMEFLI